MGSTLKKSLAAAVVTGLVASFVPVAAAADIGPNENYDFGTLTGSGSVTVNGILGSFDNVFSFTQGASTGAQTYVFGFDALGDMTVQFRAASGLTPTWPSFSSPLPIGPFETSHAFYFEQTVAGLSPGTKYWFELAGTAASATYTVTLAPVPEPENWAMMIAGLALMGVVVRRRQPNV